LLHALRVRRADALVDGKLPERSTNGVTFPQPGSRAGLNAGGVVGAEGN
jgi:hypothetical protein